MNEGMFRGQAREIRMNQISMFLTGRRISRTPSSNVNYSHERRNLQRVSERTKNQINVLDRSSTEENAAVANSGLML